MLIPGKTLIQIQRQGKTIRAGSLKERRWEKNFNLSNTTIRGSKPAFGIDKGIYDLYASRFDHFLWFDQESEKMYRLSRADFEALIGVGLVWEWAYKDHGPQWCIPILYWQIDGQPEPDIAGIVAERIAARQPKPLPTPKAPDLQLSMF